MLEARRAAIECSRGEIIQVFTGARTTTAKEVIEGWRADADFRDFFIAELAASAYPAFFWEMPPLRQKTVDDGFECAVIRSDALAAMRPNVSDFTVQLSAATEGIAAFENLGRDAILIVPSQVAGLDCYGHLAAFLREGPREQQHELFRRLATEAEQLLQAGRRFWISTSGLGVPWVHVRLDFYPKYYQHRPYAQAVS